MAISRSSDGAVEPLGREFFTRSPLVCARGLIGCLLRWDDCLATIVETEAYDAEDDPACHTFSRPSSREFVARHGPGSAYVYFNYGMHWMLNVLVKGRRSGFVLIRALEPLEGIPAMQEARGLSEPLQLCSGPGKLTRALRITGAHHGIDLCTDRAHCFLPRPGRLPPIEATPRIGISKAADFPWRFIVAGNPNVSGAKKTRPTGIAPDRSCR